MSLLTENNACTEGANWADSQIDYKTAWEKCDRAGWLLWAAKKFGVSLEKLTLAKVSCARTVQHLMTDQRSIDALDIADKFGKGEASLKELGAATNAASFVCSAYDAIGIATSASLAADAACAAADATDEAYVVVAANAARKQTPKEIANLVRKHIKFEDLILGK